MHKGSPQNQGAILALGKVKLYNRLGGILRIKEDDVERMLRGPRLGRFASAETKEERPQRQPGHP